MSRSMMRFMARYPTLRRSKTQAKAWGFPWMTSTLRREWIRVWGRDSKVTTHRLGLAGSDSTESWQVEAMPSSAMTSEAAL